MFIGHFTAGLTATKINQTHSLTLMFVAVQFLDLLWPILVLLGIETVPIQEGITKLNPLDFTHYPSSHSLLMAIFWGVVFGLIYFVVTKKGQNAQILGVLVLSHLVFDLFVHRSDLLLSSFSLYKVGFGMWNYPVMEIMIELGLFGAGIYFYYITKKPKKKNSFWALIVFLLIFQAINNFGPLSTDSMSEAVGANFIWILVIWAWWIEREKHVEPITKSIK